MTGQTPAHVFKVVVTGPFAAGKTTFIETVVQRDFVTMDAGVSSVAESSAKHSTTVGMDFGVLTLEDPDGDIELRVFGTPGQHRFSFMWEVLAEGSDVYVLVVDGSSPATWAGARAHHQAVAAAGVPGVVAVNRCPGDALERASAAFADLGVPIVACDARDATAVGETLVVALLEVLARLETARPRASGSGAIGASGSPTEDRTWVPGSPTEDRGRAAEQPREAVAAATTDDWSWL